MNDAGGGDHLLQFSSTPCTRAWLDPFVLVFCGHGREGWESSGFFGCQLFKTYSGSCFFIIFFYFLVNFEGLKEGLFLCRPPMHGGDLVSSFGLVLGSHLAWRSLPSPSKWGRQEFGGEGILSCPFCICISPLWHFLQKEPGRGFGVSQGGQDWGRNCPKEVISTKSCGKRLRSFSLGLTGKGGFVRQVGV